MSSKGSPEGIRRKKARYRARRKLSDHGPLPRYTYATSTRVEAYNSAMEKRIERWSVTTPAVYLSIPPGAPQSAKDVAAAKIARLVHGVPVLTYPQVFLSSEDYETRWEEFIHGVSGFVLNVGERGFIGERAASEVRSAIKSKLPILAQSSSGLLFPLVDCRVLHLPEPTRRRYAQVSLPAKLHNKSDTFRWTLAAMRACGLAQVAEP